MDRRNRLIRAACRALTAALAAGCAAGTAVRALGFEAAWLEVYLAALAAAAVVQLGERGTVWTVGAAAVLTGAAAALFAAGRTDIRAMIVRLGEGAQAELLPGGNAIALLAALLLGILFALLLRSSGGVPFFLIILIAAVVFAFVADESISLPLALPGMIAGLAAFAMSSEGRHGGFRPAATASALAIACLAVLIAPAARTTWAPLENLANDVRSIVEDYFHFTQQRIAFSINEKGYDRAGMIGDQVTAMLGGPADPDEGAVMKVTADRDLLLRGTVKRSYTGYSWIDDQAKARYLYYDFTHRAVRRSVFDEAVNASGELFDAVSGQVEMLSEGTSTLFVPAHLSEFSMDLKDAVYYNSAGEMFLTRDVQAGDSYAVAAYVPKDDLSLIRAASALEGVNDSNYDDALENYIQLPQSIEDGVYALADTLTRNETGAAAKAFAIQDYLIKNCSYTLNGGYPEGNRDFVSWFLLESKEGYCSYFASAMTVLCRIAGVPARYVEGYYVHAADAGETVVTGENAHAWVEVYLKGIGWTAFDPTARAIQAQQGQDDGILNDDRNEPPAGNDDIADTAPEPTPTPEADIGSDAEPTPTPEPETGADDPFENPPDEPQENPFEDPQDDPLPDFTNDNDRENRVWLWILLIGIALLLLIALAVLMIRRRLSAADPLRMISETHSAQTAALILYRGILTLLAQTGMTPAPGETPQQFAQRAVQSIPNPAYPEFVDGVTASRYSGKNIALQTLQQGRQAYTVFLNGMRRSERLRYDLRRLRYGIGNTDIVP